MHQIGAGTHQGADADDGDGTEQKNHDPAHHRNRDGIEQPAEFADKSQKNCSDSSPGHDGRIEGTGQGDGAGHFGVGGVGRATQKGGNTGSNTVTEQGVLDAGVAHVILAGDTTDGHDIAEMLDGRRQGNGNNKEDGFETPYRHGEIGDGQPGCFDRLLHGDQRRGRPVGEITRIKRRLQRSRQTGQVEKK